MGTPAEMLLTVGDNAERIRSEGALAKLCGPARSRRPAEKQPGTGSAAVVIARPTPPSIAS